MLSGSESNKDCPTERIIGVMMRSDECLMNFKLIGKISNKLLVSGRH